MCQSFMGLPERGGDFNRPRASFVIYGAYRFVAA
jgi:hypothetical protein